jgi:hypothetical protein
MKLSTRAIHFVQITGTEPYDDMIALRTGELTPEQFRKDCREHVTTPEMADAYVDDILTALGWRLRP